MAKQHRIVKSEDATTIIVEGDRGIPQLPEMDGIDKIAVKFEAKR